jgi:RNA recognition motif-containing protein
MRLRQTKERTRLRAKIQSKIDKPPRNTPKFTKGEKRKLLVFDESNPPTIIKGRTLFIRNFPQMKTLKKQRKSLKALFRKKYGGIEDIRFEAVPITNVRSVYVTFRRKESATAVLERNGTIQMGQEILDIHLAMHVDNEGDFESISDDEYELPRDNKQISRSNTTGNYSTRMGTTFDEYNPPNIVANRTILIGNFPQNQKCRRIVEKLFKKFGKMAQVCLETSIEKRHTRRVYVTFREERAAMAALNVNGQRCGDVLLEVTLAVSDQVEKLLSCVEVKREAEYTFPDEEKETDTSRKRDRDDFDPADRNHRSVTVSGLSDTVNAAKLRKIFELYGEIESIRFTMQFSSLQPNSGMAVIQFESIEAATTALKENETIIDGQMVMVTLMSKISPELEEFQVDEVQQHEDLVDRTIIVKRLPKSANEMTLIDLFLKHGYIELIRFKLTEYGSNEHTGKAFIQFETVESAKSAVHEHHVKVEGSKIKVRLFTK